jgi:sulfate adenylyltransferase
MYRLIPSVRSFATTATGGAFGSKTPVHGGGNKLVNNMIGKGKDIEGLKRGVNSVVELNERQSCDTELLMVGAFTPVDGFMNSNTYKSVVERMRLPPVAGGSSSSSAAATPAGKDDGVLFGLPVVLDTRRDDIKPGQKLLLRWNNTDLAIMDVEDRYIPDKPNECLKCYGTTKLEHPGVRMVAMERGPIYIGGKLTGLNIPKRVFPCDTPQQVRDSLPSNKDVVAFQNRNPIHRAHYELFMRALDAPNVDKKGGAIVLVHPTVGPTQEDDIPGVVRYHTYEVLKKELEEQKNKTVKWAYLPYSMHMAGPREAIQHMILRKNYGCTHFIIGRDMAGSKSSITGDDFYGPFEAQDMAKKYSNELGMKTVPSLNLVYTEEGGYVTSDVADQKKWKPKKLSGTEFRRKLRAGEDIPEWFAFKSVVEVLRKHV